MAITLNDAASGPPAVRSVDDAASGTQVPSQVADPSGASTAEINAAPVGTSSSTVPMGSGSGDPATSLPPTSTVDTPTNVGAQADQSPTSQIGAVDTSPSVDVATSAGAQRNQSSAPQTDATSARNATSLQSAAATQDAASSNEMVSATPALDHMFIGLDGSPIRGLKYRFESDGSVIDGVTDSDGNAAPVKSFSAGSDCTVSVLTDSGVYKQVACYMVPTADTSATLMSGSMVLESETQQHGGSSDDVSSEPSSPAKDTGKAQTHPAYSSEDELPTGVAKAPSSSGNGGTSPVTASGGSSATKPSSGNPTTAPSGTAAGASNPKDAPKTKGSSGKPTPTKATTTTTRDSLGHPQAAPAEPFMDWANHKVHAAWHYIEDLFGLDSNPVAGKAAPPKTQSKVQTSSTASSAPQDLTALQSLIKLAEEQTAHTMPSSHTVDNLNRLISGSMTYGNKPESKSLGQCYMYVKIALWRANAIKFLQHKKGEFDSIGGSYAKVAGAFLMSQGFENVTDQLPDARWALPGDVIVYHVKGDTETADGKGREGHIDIRTYHYYISDFKRNYLCFRGYRGGLHYYEPIGIYRKPGFSDPLALARMKAFLKIIRSREAKTFFAIGDDKTYTASQGVYRIQDGIKDFSTYPLNPNKSEDHQGAYQLARSSWSRGHSLESGALPSDFSPQTQDRYAVWLMEGEPGRFGPKPDYPPVPSALGYIRQGDIDQAVSMLRKRQWPSLPGGGQDQGYTIAEMKADFAKYLKEYGGA
ncbi:flagellar hook-length control protein FliK [Burkholderia ubonensis]|uniref:flagellar hook-length control protein FliK n=1 Tax=Burkholderia ubonensis TaxID=101571 RepID=UPI000B006722|nr:flagellar hook-length control protein FliK [Burkholderia ubonensis]